MLGELLVDEREAARGRGRCARSTARSSGAGPGTSATGLREPCSAAATAGRAVRTSRSATASGTVRGSGSAAGTTCRTVSSATATAVPPRPAGSARMSGSLGAGCTCSSTCSTRTARHARRHAAGSSACCGRSCRAAVHRSRCA